MVEDRREIGTTYAFAPPRVYENLLTLTMVRMEDAGALKRTMFDYLHRASRGSWGEKILNSETVPLHARLLYWLGDVLVYGAAEEPLRPLAHPRRLYGGRGDRAGDLPLLSRARHQPEAALRADRGLGLHHRAAGRRNLRRHGRQAEHRRRGQDRRQRRSAVQVARRVRRLLQGPGEDRRGQDAGRLGAHRRRRLLRSEDRPPEDHRPRQGCRPAQRRHAVRAEIHREQAQVLSQHPRGGGVRRRARLRLP